MTDAYGELRPPTLLALPSYVASHVARIGHRHLSESLKEHALRLPHFAVLTALSDFGALPQHELADRLGLNRSHLVGYLDEVEQRDLVRRERDPHDRRRQRVALTPAGRKLVRRLKEAADRSQTEFLRPLTAAERTTLMELLGRILRADDQDRTAPGPLAENA